SAVGGVSMHLSAHQTADCIGRHSSPGRLRVGDAHDGREASACRLDPVPTAGADAAAETVRGSCRCEVQTKGHDERTHIMATTLSFMRGFLKSYGPSIVKKRLWDEEFSGGHWNFIDETSGDCVYPY